MLKLAFHFGSGLLHDSVCIIFCPPPAMFQIIKHIKTSKSLGRSTVIITILACLWKLQGRPGEQFIMQAQRPGDHSITLCTTPGRDAAALRSCSLIEHGGQWGPAAGLWAQSWKEGGSEWQPDPPNLPLLFVGFALEQIQFFGASVFLVCRREFMMAPLSSRCLLAGR